MKKIIALIAGILASLSAFAAGPFYVDADNGSDSNSGTGCVNFSSGAACATSWKSIHNTAVEFAGTIEYVRASTASYGFMYLHDLPGTASQPIQFIGTPGPRGARPLVKQASSGQVGALQIAYNSTYVVVNGFDFWNPTNLNPNGSAALIGSTTNPCTNNHITIENSSFFNSGGGGISAEYMDYLTLLNNLVHDNGSTITTASPSGISLLAFCNFDTAPGYHNEVQNNEIYNEASTTGSTVASDYNCFISDDQDHYQAQSITSAGAAPYTGATIVQYNLAFGCQGKGFHDWASQNVIVFDHNTDFMNCTVAGKPCGSTDGDLDMLGASGHYSANATFSYNVVVAPYYAINISGVAGGGTATARCNYEYGTSGSKSANWDNSGTFTNTFYSISNPNLLAPSTSPAGADFRAMPPVLPTGC